jgi:hypothetical protein
VAVAVANADGAIELSVSTWPPLGATSLPPSLLPLLPAAAPVLLPLLLGLLLLSGTVSAAGQLAMGVRPAPPLAAAVAAARAAASCFAFLRLAAETAAHQLAASKASKPCSWTFSAPAGADKNTTARCRSSSAAVRPLGCDLSGDNACTPAGRLESLNPRATGHSVRLLIQIHQ